MAGILDRILDAIDPDRRAMRERLAALERFHDAWTEHQCGLATGDPEIAREKKRALMAAQRAVLETRK